MALKAYINGSMKKITRHKMVTFINGTKKHLPKGITFVNGEKKILWQVGNYALNTWQIETLQYPNTVNVTYPVLGLEAAENKIVYFYDKYICRANVTNLSSPYNDGVVDYGYVTNRREESTSSVSYFDSNKTAVSGRTFSSYYYRINVALPDLTVTADQEATATYTSDYQIVQVAGSRNYFNNSIYVNSTYGLCRFIPVSGAYEVYKNYDAQGSTSVATISSNGFSGAAKPTVWCYALYNNRYILFGAEYQATDGGAYTYSIKRVDLTNGNVTTLLNNQTDPINSILVDGTNLIVTVGNTVKKMNINGSVSATYTSPNDMTTLVGKCGNYYYVTTTRSVYSVPYMNIEIIDESNFASGEVKETDIKMIETDVLPYISNTGYLCFATRYYETSVSAGGTGGGHIGGIARTASIKQLGGGTGTGTYVSYSNVEIRICRIQCY